MQKQCSASFGINSASIRNRRCGARKLVSAPHSRITAHGFLSRLIAVCLIGLLGILTATTQAADPSPNNEKNTGNSSGSTSTQSTQTGPTAPASKVTPPAIRDAKIKTITGTGGTSGTTTGQTETAATSALRAQAEGDLTNGQTDQKPGIDQGFRNKPGQIDAGGSVGGNPISTNTGCPGGLLGTAACSQTGSTGVASQGTALIKQSAKPGSVTAGIVNNAVRGATGTLVNTNADGELTGSNAAGNNGENPLGGQGDPNLRAGLRGDDNSRQQQMDSASCDSGDAAACNRMKAPQETSASGGESKEKTVFHASGNTTRYNADGSFTHTTFNADDSYTETTVKKEDTKDKNGNATSTTTVTKTTYDNTGKKTGETTASSTTSPCDPSDCGSTPESIAKFYAENPALISQIRQSKSGDGGNIDFGRGDTAPGVVRSGTLAPVGGGSTGLLGNPGVRGGLGETGSVDTTTNFGNSQGAGAINPGQDGNLNTTGGRTDNVDERINGGQPNREFPNNTAGTGSGSGTSASAPKQPLPPVRCVKGHPVPALRCPE